MTSLCEVATIWAILNGWHQFTQFVMSLASLLYWYSSGNGGE
jgi:hypothetical protein